MARKPSERNASNAPRSVGRLRLLGGFELLSRDGTPVKLPTRKMCQLLAYLAMPAGQPHAREKLAGIFWGETQDEQARGSLRRALTALRAALGPAALDVDHATVALLPGHLEVDTDRLAGIAPKQAALGSADFDGLYRGEFLSGYSLDNEAFADWLLFERTRLRNLAEGVLHGAIARAQEDGRHGEAIGLAERLVALDPLREHSHRTLIELHLATSERSKALAHFQKMKALLWRELAIEPSPETAALLAAAKAQTSPREPDAVSPPHARAARDAPEPSAVPGPSTIAVLPFPNVSGDPEQDYFADGMSEDIIAGLSKVSGLLVISRNSSFAFKGKTVAASEVSRRLGARYLVEGSVRKSGKRVRITALLVDATTGAHLWVERFDRELRDIFEVQDDVARQITAALAVRLDQGAGHKLVGSQTHSIEAYDCFLRGRELHHRYSRETAAQARQLLERAIALDGRFAAAHAYLGLVLSIDYVNNWTADPEKTLATLRQHAETAVALDAGCGHGHWALGAAALLSRRHDEALTSARRAVWLNPSFAEGYSYLAYVLHYCGHFEDSLIQAERVATLDPGYPDMVLHIQAQSHFQLGRYEAAIALLKRRLIRRPDTDVSRVLLASCFGHLGQQEAARAAWSEMLAINPEYSLAHRRTYLPYRDPAHLEHFFAGLRKAGLAI